MPDPSTSRAGPPWTTRRLLGWIAPALTQAGVEAPRVCAELLVAHVIGCDRLRLYADPDRPASAPERDRLRALVARALQHEPVQYLVGEAWFFSRPFTVDRRVLIPRPETELLVETLLQTARDRGDLASGAIAELGVGSGCVIVSALAHLPGARGVGVDISPDALAVARANAERHGVSDRLDLIGGDLYDALDAHPAGRRVSAILSNPPYVADADWDTLDPHVREEPAVALLAGPDGLSVIRRILAGAAERLTPGGLLAVEIGVDQADAALALARGETGLRDARVERDFQGRPRALIAHRA